MLTPGPNDTLADAIGKAAKALDTSEPLEFVRHVGDSDAYVRGPRPGGYLFVLPGIWTGMPADLLAAMRLRRKANVTGRCPRCDACVQPATGTWVHERRCPVADDVLGPRLSRWARQVGPARGRRIQEQP